MSVDPLRDAEAASDKESLAVFGRGRRFSLVAKGLFGSGMDGERQNAGDPGGGRTGESLTASRPSFRSAAASSTCPAAAAGDKGAWLL